MSITFRDAKDRDWLVVLNLAALKRMRLMASFTLEDVIPKEITSKDAAAKSATAYSDFLNDDIRFSEVLWAIVQPQADAKGITQEQFDEGLAGEANQRAILAFHGAFTDFSQNPRKKFLRGMQIGLNRMVTRLEAFDKEVTDEKLEKAMDDLEASKPPAGESPESSALTPAS